MFLSLRRKTRISDLKPGKVVVIEGEILSNNELSLPGTGTRCVYFDMVTEVYKKGPRGKGRPLWLPLKADRRCAGFMVGEGNEEVWICDDVQAIIVNNGVHEAGQPPKKEFRRYSACMLQKGNRVKIRGLVDEPRQGEPSGVLVIRPTRRDIIEILRRK